MTPVRTYVRPLSPLRKEFDRLKHLTQLGVAQTVFPLARHTRYEHSLGVYHLTQLWLNALKGKGAARFHAPSLKAAALLHPIGHLPYAYSSERALWLAMLDNSGLRDEFVEIHQEVSGKIQCKKCRTALSGIKAIKNADYAKLNRWLAAYKVLANSRAFIDTKAEPLKIAKYIACVHDPANALLEELDVLDHVPRDLWHTGEVHAQFPLERIAAEIEIGPDSRPQPPRRMFLIYAAYMYMLEQVYTDSLVAIARQCASLYFHQGFTTGALTLADMLRANDHRTYSPKFLRKEHRLAFTGKRYGLRQLQNHVINGKIVHAFTLTRDQSRRRRDETDACSLQRHLLRCNTVNVRRRQSENGVYIHVDTPSLADAPPLYWAPIITIGFDKDHGSLRALLGAYARAVDSGFTTTRRGRSVPLALATFLHGCPAAQTIPPELEACAVRLVGKAYSDFAPSPNGRIYTNKQVGRSFSSLMKRDGRKAAMQYLADTLLTDPRQLTKTFLSAVSKRAARTKTHKARAHELGLLADMMVRNTKYAYVWGLPCLKVDLDKKRTRELDIFIVRGKPTARPLVELHMATVSSSSEKQAEDLGKLKQHAHALGMRYGKSRLAIQLWYNGRMRDMG